MRPHAFVLAVPDLDSSVRYFMDVLGFQAEWRDGNNCDKRAIVLGAPEDKPWGRREMAIATPDGHRMMFSQSI